MKLLLITKSKATGKSISSRPKKCAKTIICHWRPRCCFRNRSLGCFDIFRYAASQRGAGGNPSHFAGKKRGGAECDRGDSPSSARHYPPATPHLLQLDEGNPLEFMLRFVLFGEGDIPVTTREVLRKAEPDSARRPGVYVGG